MLRIIAVACLVVFVISVAMLVVGDPFWNLYVVSLGLFVALPVGVVVAFVLMWSRRHSSRT